MQADPRQTRLHLPLRLQWQNGNGYCGQTCLQICSLYFGSYISQAEVRKLAHGEVLVGENAQPTLQKLGYAFEVWDSEQEQPQYRNYLQWVKTNLHRGRPVIICGLEPEGYHEYDHIYMAVGVKSKDYSKYNEDDVLIYMDLFCEEYLETDFRHVWDDRDMNRNGKNLNFAIPKDMCFGIAVKGLAHLSSICKPVRVQLPADRIEQPNITQGQQTQKWTIKVICSHLQPGTHYTLLKYTKHQNLPVDSISLSKAAEVYNFVPEASTYIREDTVWSNKRVFYRCTETTNVQQ